jgi:hypothetical protein
MTDDAAQFLMTAQGAEATALASGFPDDPLKAGTELRRRFPDVAPSHLAAAAELAEARVRADGIYARADELYFTRAGLEMATGERVAIHRAERFAGLKRVVDACSGIGGDAMALAAVADRLVCVDTDQAHLRFCVENCRITAGRKPEPVARDVRDIGDALDGADALFIDPARRKGGRRAHGLTDMEPPIDVVLSLLVVPGRGAAKLSPALDSVGIPDGCELEWVSNATGLKEAVLWYGDLRRAVTTVSLLHRDCTVSDADLPRHEAPVDAPGAYLFEPDPALIRSGLLRRAASSCGMWMLDPHIAYCTADNPVESPLFRGYRVIERERWGRSRFREMLNAHGAGRVTVKKRGFPLTPEEVTAGLSLNGDSEAVVILTRIGDGHVMFLVEPV